MAQPFDASSQRFNGDGTVLNDNVQVGGSVWRGMFTASDTASLIYQPGVSSTGLALRWFDRSGKELGTTSAPDAYQGAALS
jgi:hypothetical protein